MRITHLCRNNLFVQFRKFPVDLIASREHHRPLFQRIIDRIATTVGHPTIGIGVAGTPLDLILLTSVLTGQLAVVGRAATVVIFCTHLVIRLGIDSGTIRITVRRQLIDNMFEFDLVVTRSGKIGQIEHGSETHIVVVLIVGRMAQVVAPVIRLVIHTEQVVDHIGIGPIFVRIVQGSDQPPLGTGPFPPMAPLGTQFQVTPGLSVLYTPIIIEPIVQQTGRSTTIRFGQYRLESAREGTKDPVEP